MVLSHRSLRSPSLYVELIDTYTRNRALKPGRSLHAHLIINGLSNSSLLSSKLIPLYAACNQFRVARKVFDEIPNSIIRGWVALIGSSARNGYYHEAVTAFSEMQEHGFNHDRIVLPSVLKACGHLRDRNRGEKIHAAVRKIGLRSDPFVMCALIDMYSKCGVVESAERVFHAMPEVDLVSLNTMVSGYVHNSRAKEAFSLVEKMRLLPGVQPDIVTWNSLILGFSQANDQAMVGRIFEIMDAVPDVVSFTSVIAGLVQNFHSTKACSFFRKMLKDRVFPTPSTLSTLLPACASTANLRRGKEIHGYSIVMGLEEDVYVKSALIDMYAKCGSIYEAMSIFQNMPERNTVTWNSMIFGYANHGYCEEAIELFHQMAGEDERKLDHLSFTAALTACVHAGMVGPGERLFRMMREKYGIAPRAEHYACMVDLLGRAGKVEEACGIIRGMPVEPDVFVWGALLGACRTHGRMDLAGVAAERLAVLEPKSSGSSVVLLSMYAESSRWGNAVELKRVMKKRKLTSFPSRSWI